MGMVQVETSLGCGEEGRQLGVVVSSNDDYLYREAAELPEGSCHSYNLGQVKNQRPSVVFISYLSNRSFLSRSGSSSLFSTDWRSLGISIWEKVKLHWIQLLFRSRIQIPADRRVPNYLQTRMFHMSARKSNFILLYFIFLNCWCVDDTTLCLPT